MILVDNAYIGQKIHRSRRTAKIRRIMAVRNAQYREMPRRPQCEK